MIESGKLFSDIGLPDLDLANDRFMLCGSPQMLKDTCAILDAGGFKEARHGDAGHYVIERAFVD